MKARCIIRTEIDIPERVAKYLSKEEIEMVVLQSMAKLGDNNKLLDIEVL